MQRMRGTSIELTKKKEENIYFSDSLFFSHSYTRLHSISTHSLCVTNLGIYSENIEPNLIAVCIVMCIDINEWNMFNIAIAISIHLALFVISLFPSNAILHIFATLILWLLIKL